MRILHIDTERGWRGGERQALWLAAELARREHVSIVAARPGEPLAQRAPAQGIELLPCAPAFEADPRGVLALRRYLRARSIEVVHAHTAHAAGLGALATLGMDVPLVVARRVDFRLRRNVGTRWKYGRAAAVIAVSRAVAEVLAQGGVAREATAPRPAFRASRQASALLYAVRPHDLGFQSRSARVPHRGDDVDVRPGEP